jgi:hypothetical protein
MIGEYEPGTPGINGHIWHATVNSGNLINTTPTTFDGGAYNGFIGGSILRNATTGNDNMDTRFLALYIEPGTTSPYKTGVLKGSLTGTGYPQSLTFEQDGTIYETKLGSTTVEPTSLYSYSTPSAWTGSTSFIFNEYPMSDYVYAKETMILTGTDWAIGKITIGGSYSGITTGSTFQWNIIETVGSPYTMYQERDIAGTWANGKLTGTGFSYGANISGPTVTPTTSWIGVGDVVGTFDANATVFQAVWLGMRLDTNKYLAMVDDATGRTRLGQLGIPACEVGIIPTMSGSAGTNDLYSNYINVTIQNMRFFAPTGGGTTAPQLWATNGVSGTYSGNPVNLSANLSSTVSDGNFGALFTVRNWNAGTGGNNWMGTIANGSGALTITGSQGLYGSAITFKGAAAGTITTPAVSGTSLGIFSGNAAGRVKTP